MELIGLIFAFGLLLLVLHWWSEGMLEAAEAVALAAVLCGLGFGIFAADTVLQRILAFVPFVGMVAYTLYSFRIGGVRALLKEKCEQHMLVIQADPKNYAARQFLADTLYALGDLDRAIDEMQVAVEMGAGMECQYNLAKWTRERYVRDCANPVCKWCHTENDQRARACSKCGAALPYSNAFMRWLRGGRNAGARVYLTFTVGLAVVCLSVALLPLKFALIPIFLLVVALTGWSLIN